MVTVTATGFNNTTIDGKSITLTPYKSASALMTSADIGGQTIFQWKCGPAASNAMPSKYLPGSCRG